MQKMVSTALLASVLGAGAAMAEPMLLQADRYNTTGSIRRTAPAYVAPQAPVQQQRRYASAEQGTMGGGFIEFLFGGGQPVAAPRPPGEVYAHAGHAAVSQEEIDPRRLPPDPKFLKQVVPYSGKEKPGTIVIDTSQRFLFLVQGDGTALRYGIGVGRDGFTWSGAKTVSAKKEWPDWRPPEEMLQRRPDLPGFMAGGPENPLGARALYLGSSLYRIHGSNEPWTIGQAVSSGCFRLRNEDVIDLYDRVKVGARVVVM
jgi:lipoprotein-anchoring transpeptidase ErfK/SrfK